MRVPCIFVATKKQSTPTTQIHMKFEIQPKPIYKLVIFVLQAECSSIQLLVKLFLCFLYIVKLSFQEIWHVDMKLGRRRVHNPFYIHSFSFLHMVMGFISSLDLP
jgi:hypothetical protein